jgi:hypothetical protein
MSNKVEKIAASSNDIKTDKLIVLINFLDERRIPSKNSNTIKIKNGYLKTTRRDGWL